VNNLKSISREEDGNKGELFGYDDANQLSSVSYKADVTPHAPGGPGGVGGDSEEMAKDTERDSIAALEADPVREPLAEGAVGLETPVTGPRTVTYNNDAINRRSMTDSGAVTNYMPNGLNQYTAVTSHGALSYDGTFNLSHYDIWTYVYDADKRLISATGNGHSAQFVYDGLGRCVRRTIDSVATVLTYDGWKPIVEWTGAGEFVAWNLYGPGADEILIRYQPNTGGYLRYHLDAMGNVQFLLSDDPTNPGLEKYTYDAFGRPTITGWAGEPRPISSYGNRFLFTGREYLYTLGLYDYRHRHYHPGLGRFIQTDPLGMQIEGAKLSAAQTALYGDGAPKTFSSSESNLYRYCHNNPVYNADPYGLIDREIDPQVDKLGVQASLNSLKQAANGAPAGVSQAVQQKDGMLSLGSQFGKSEIVTEKKLIGGRLQTVTTLKETAKSDPEHQVVAVGHVHQDKSIHAGPEFSATDYGTAQGSEGHPGKPVYKVNESNPSVIIRLTPQVDYHDTPTKRVISH
jgi:RHS repeat-associated protein